MGNMNFRNAYNTDSGNYGSPGAGGLLDMLLAMVQQRQVQPGAGFDPGIPGNGTPPVPQASDYGPTPPTRIIVRPPDAHSPSDPETQVGEGGLLGRLLALQAEQSRYQPPPANDGQTPFVPQNPNFRQVSRAPIQIPPQGASGPSHASDDQSSPSYSSFEGSGNVVSTGYRGGIPFPPTGPVPLPTIPVPAIPDWWKAAGPILRRVFSGVASGGNDDYSRCVRAADGSTEQWEEFCKNLGLGQNKTSGGETQNRACWSKTYESPANKRQWCENQFNDH